jgi:hypothetical protein
MLEGDIDITEDLAVAVNLAQLDEYIKVVMVHAGHVQDCS